MGKQCTLWNVVLLILLSPSSSSSSKPHPRRIKLELSTLGEGDDHVKIKVGRKKLTRGRKEIPLFSPFSTLVQLTYSNLRIRVSRIRTTEKSILFLFHFFPGNIRRRRYETLSLSLSSFSVPRPAAEDWAWKKGGGGRKERRKGRKGEGACFDEKEKEKGKNPPPAKWVPGVTFSDACPIKDYFFWCGKLRNVCHVWFGIRMRERQKKINRYQYNRCRGGRRRRRWRKCREVRNFMIFSLFLFPSFRGEVLINGAPSFALVSLSSRVSDRRPATPFVGWGKKGVGCRNVRDFFESEIPLDLWYICIPNDFKTAMQFWIWFSNTCSLSANNLLCVVLDPRNPILISISASHFLHAPAITVAEEKKRDSRGKKIIYGKRGEGGYRVTNMRKKRGERGGTRNFCASLVGEKLFFLCFASSFKPSWGKNGKERVAVTQKPHNFK